MSAPFDPIRIVEIVPNLAIAVYVIYLGFKLFVKITDKIDAINGTLTRLVTLIELMGQQGSRRGPGE